MTSYCSAPGCRTLLPPRQPFCRSCQALIPTSIALDLARAEWGSSEHCRALGRARKAVSIVAGIQRQLEQACAGRDQ